MWEKELASAIKAGEKARRLILDIYKNGFKVKIKEDKSPVTDADVKADKLIKESLEKDFPTYAYLSEEGIDNKNRFNNDYVWIVDPLDGTCNFVEKNDEFTINIALAYKHKVVVGVVIIPVTGEMYYATNHGGAFYSVNGSVREIHVNSKTSDLRVLLSRSHHGDIEEETLKKYGSLIKEKKYLGAAIKPCVIAKGEGELSIRLNDRTKEWDTAAPQIIVKEADGLFITPKGEWMEYNRKDVVNRDGYIITNKKKNIIL